MKVYILTETHEQYGIRDFNIISVRTNKEKALDEMWNVIKEDRYEDFKNNGIGFKSETYCESNYDDYDCCFTAYEIIEKEVEE